MKVRIKVRPTGYINGQSWPAVGETMDLPQVVAESMGDWLDVVKAETRPAKGKVEKRNVGSVAE
jgi:hypothetical protein